MWKYIGIQIGYALSGESNNSLIARPHLFVCNSDKLGVSVVIILLYSIAGNLSGYM